MNTFTLENLLRPNIRAAKPYSSARSEFTGTADVFLDANENAFGSPSQTSTNGAYNRYPDPLQKTLKARLAEIKHVAPEQIFIGNGSDEVIDLLIRAFCEPAQDELIITPPTYGMYEVSAEIQNARVVRVPLLREGLTYSIDVERLLAAITERTKIIFLCSPGNPTGNSLSADALRQIIQGFHGIVVLDEAYIDFAPETSFVAELGDHPNLVIMQTLSKAWGLAGLRLGMAFASQEIITVLNKIKPPYNINSVTQQLVLKALENTVWKERVVRETLEERRRLEVELPKFSVVEALYPSDANFLLVRVTKPREIYEALVRQGIIVRDRSSVTLCEGCLRITVGTHDENTRLLAILNTLPI